MNENERKEIEKIEQEQLINSILSRKGLETEALIEAVKENPSNIEKRKQEILNSKIEEQENENKRQIEERKEMLRSVEEELKKWNEEEKKANIKRQEEVDRILEEINAKSKKTQRARANLEKYDRERFRRKFNSTVQKKEQLQTKEKEEKIKRALDEISEKEHILPQKEVLPPKKTDKKKKQRKNPPSKKATPTNKKTNVTTNYKTIKGIKAYEDNMNFYAQGLRKELFSRTIGNSSFKEVRKKFMNALKFSVNTKEAVKEAQKQPPRTFKPRTL